MSDSNETQGVGFEGAAGVTLGFVTVLLPFGAAAGVSAFLASRWVGGVTKPEALTIAVTTALVSVALYLANFAWTVRRLRKHHLSNGEGDAPGALAVGFGWFAILITLPPVLGLLWFQVPLLKAVFTGLATLTLSVLIGVALTFVTVRVMSVIARRALAPTAPDDTIE